MHFLLIILLLMFIIMYFAIFFIVPFQVHHTQVKHFTSSWGYGDYGKFRYEFDKRYHEWQRDRKFPDSLFIRTQDVWDYKNELHANIIQFDGIGMIIKSPIDYWRIHFYVRKYIRNHPLGAIHLHSW